MKKLILIILFFTNVNATSIYVNYNSGNDVSGNGTSGSPYKTFHKVYTMATTSDTIYLSGTFTWTNSDETGDIANTGYTIGKNLTIIGEGPGNTIVQAHSSANSADRKVFNISNNMTVTFKNLTIRHGKISSGYYGAAIGSTSGSSSGIFLTLENVNISTNNSGDGHAAGVYCDGTFIAQKCTFENNTGTYDHAIALELEVGTGTQKQRDIINCTFYNNTSTNANAPAVFVSSLGANFMNCTFIGNTNGFKTWDPTGTTNIRYITNCIIANSTGYDLYALQGKANNNVVLNSIIEVVLNGSTANSFTTCIQGNQVNLNVTTPTTTGENANNLITPILQLATNSVAINAGLSTGSIGTVATSGAIVTVPTTDQVYNNRTSPYDIGAFEYGGVLSLPVELKSFTANVINGIVNLNWVTITESNNFGFDVERKSGKSNWEKIGFIKGSGTSNSEKNYTYKDASIKKGKYSYRLKQIDLDGRNEYQNPVEVTIGLNPNKIVLDGNYPNPFNSETVISYQIPVKGKVLIELYDVLGKKVSEIYNGEEEAGFYEKRFNANNLSTGIYYYKLQSNGQSVIKKMVLMK